MKNMLTVFHLSTPFNFIVRNDAFQELCKLLLCHEEVGMAYVDPIFYGAIDAVGPFNEVDMLIIAALLEKMGKERFYSGCSMHPEAFTGTVSAFIGAEDFGFLILWQIVHLLSVAKEQVLSCLS